MRSILPLIVLITGFLQLSGKPNILLIMAHDMGYSDLGCFGGETRTPSLDS
jgi:arylsulfatase